jgi:predicted Zn-ribbon and HTH transcriptional regulator
MLVLSFAARESGGGPGKGITLNLRKSSRCPHCRSIDFRKVGSEGAMEVTLRWLLHPFRCDLCGHHFYLFPWQVPVEV